jgi:hypothetical protein
LDFQATPFCILVFTYLLLSKKTPLKLLRDSVKRLKKLADENTGKAILYIYLNIRKGTKEKYVAAVKFRLHAWSDIISKKKTKVNTTSEDKWIEWKDNIPRTGMGNDDIALVHFIPDAFGIDATKTFTDKLVEFAKSNGVTQPGTGADRSGRNKAEGYIRRQNEIVGMVKLVRAWHAIGKTVRQFIFTY